MDAAGWDHLVHLEHVMHTSRDPGERADAHRAWLSTLVSHTNADHAERQREHDERMRQQQ